MNEARALAAELATKPPIALRYAMEAVNQRLEMPFAEACRLEASLFGMVTATEDMREGTRAFLEKRKPEFKRQRVDRDAGADRRFTSQKAPGLKFAIVVSKFNDFVTDRLQAGALEGLKSAGVLSDDVCVIKVPGAFEIPFAAKEAAARGNVRRGHLPGLPDSRRHARTSSTSRRRARTASPMPRRRPACR